MFPDFLDYTPKISDFSDSLLSATAKESTPASVRNVRDDEEKTGSLAGSNNEINCIGICCNQMFSAL